MMEYTHIHKEQLPGSVPGTWRFVFWCGKEQDNVALSPHGGMSSDTAPPTCPECEDAKAKEDEG